MKMDQITKNLLKEIAGLHDVPRGAVSFRKNGKGQVVRSTENINITPKDDGSGIDIFISSNCKGEACHLPVIVTENGLFDLVYNDFYVEAGAEVTIVAGCGLHSGQDGGHDGIHTFHIGKGARVTYVENHFATGTGKNKQLNPTTIIKMEENSSLAMNTTQIGGVDYSNRSTKATLKDGAVLTVNEKIVTNRFDVAKSDFFVKLKGANSRCTIASRSVAKGESEQQFKSNLVGENACFGRVECDGILLDDARIISIPKISAKHKLAELSHEAAVGKIAGEQIVKLMTLGLTQAEAENKIIEGFLK